MPVFKWAWRTQAGNSPGHDVVAQLATSHRPNTPRWIVLARQTVAFSLNSSTPGPTAPLTSSEAVEAALRASGLEPCLSVLRDPTHLTLTCWAASGVWHYFRFADGAVKPLPSDPEPLTFAPGDTYVALTPGAQQVADSPALARFIHLRDYFNAEKLAEALLAHLIELASGAGVEELSEDVTALVIEVR